MPAPVAALASTRADRVALAASTLAYFVAQGAMVPTVPRLLSGPVGATSITVGLVLAAFSVTAVLVRVPLAALGPRLGTRPALLLGAGLVVLAAAALAGAQHLAGAAAFGVTLAVIARALAGTGDALYYPAATQVAYAAAPPARSASTLSRFTVVVYGGLLLGPAAGDALWSRAGFGAVWTLTGTAAVAAVALALGVPRPARTTVQSHRAATDKSRRRLLVPRDVWAAAALTVLITVPVVGYSSFASLYSSHLGQASAAIDLAAFAAVAIVGRVALAPVLDRWPADRQLAGVCVGGAAGCLLLAGWATPTGFLVGSVVLGGTQACALPVLLAAALSRVHPDNRAATTSVLTGCHDVAFGAAAALGVALQLGGYAVMFVVAAVASIAGLPLCRSLRAAPREADRHPSDTPPTRGEGR